jgi:hypothetical protein
MFMLFVDSSNEPGGRNMALFGYYSAEMFVLHDAEEKRRRGLVGGIMEKWKLTAKTINEENATMLQKEARREAVNIIEDAARTEKEFDEVTILWDCLNIVEGWRVAKQETKRTELLTENEEKRCVTVIPQPINHIWWRELINGNFLDVIHDCPHDIYELTSSCPVYAFTKSLDEKQKEILYYWAIRQWTPQQIAAFRGQTDRNIRKVYNKMIDDMRLKLYDRLYPRYIKFLPLTFSQISFIEWYILHYCDGETRGDKPLDTVSVDKGEPHG